MKILFIATILLLFIGLLNSCKAQYVSTFHLLVAKPYNSGFEHAHESYNAISSASYGRIYYCLSAPEVPDVSAQLYAFDPSNEEEEIEHLGDLTEICGEGGSNAIPQGKVHTNFYERAGKLYFATHTAYSEIVDGMEAMAKNPPEGYELYPGGPIYIDGQRIKGKDQIVRGASKVLGNLVTYNIPHRKYIDHGPIFYTNGTKPTWVNSIAIGPYENVYSLGRYEQNGKVIADLFKILNPVKYK